KNQELQHKDLLRAVLAQINYFYELRACINEDLSFNRGSLPDFWSELINFLKKMNDMIQITGKEMEELIYTSQWRDEARPLLAKVIEFKNFCLYCNFNMPRGAIICPNCKKEVQPVVIEAPQMNLGSMQDFFSQSTSQADMSANSPAGPAASLGGIRKCPKCGGLVSADDNTCMNCQYKVPL
nr:zinc ribbon domain-containing protein [Candidatus Sigynarchaeota archaeon]